MNPGSDFSHVTAGKIEIGRGSLGCAVDGELQFAALWAKHHWIESMRYQTIHEIHAGRYYEEQDSIGQQDLILANRSCRALLGERTHSQALGGSRQARLL
jgi:hypothetical protein